MSSPQLEPRIQTGSPQSPGGIRVLPVSRSPNGSTRRTIQAMDNAELPFVGSNQVSDASQPVQSLPTSPLAGATLSLGSPVGVVRTRTIHHSKADVSSLMHGGHRPHSPQPASPQQFSTDTRATKTVAPTVDGELASTHYEEEEGLSEVDEQPQADDESSEEEHASSSSSPSSSSSCSSFHSSQSSSEDEEDEEEVEEGASSDATVSGPQSIEPLIVSIMKEEAVLYPEYTLDPFLMAGSTLPPLWTIRNRPPSTIFSLIVGLSSLPFLYQFPPLVRALLCSSMSFEYFPPMATMAFPETGQNDLVLIIRGTVKVGSVSVDFQSGDSFGYRKSPPAPPPPDPFIAPHAAATTSISSTTTETTMTTTTAITIVKDVGSGDASERSGAPPDTMLASRGIDSRGSSSSPISDPAGSSPDNVRALDARRVKRVTGEFKGHQQERMGSPVPTEVSGGEAEQRSRSTSPATGEGRPIGLLARSASHRRSSSKSPDSSPQSERRSVQIGDESHAPGDMSPQLSDRTHRSSAGGRRPSHSLSIPAGGAELSPAILSGRRPSLAGLSLHNASGVDMFPSSISPTNRGRRPSLSNPSARRPSLNGATLATPPSSTRRPSLTSASLMAAAPVISTSAPAPAPPSEKKMADRRGSLSAALSRGGQVVLATSDCLVARIPFALCDVLFSSSPTLAFGNLADAVVRKAAALVTASVPIADLSTAAADDHTDRPVGAPASTPAAEMFIPKAATIVWAPMAARDILLNVEPKSRSEGECSIVIELFKSVDFLRTLSKEMQRILANEFMHAKVEKDESLCFWKGPIGDSRSCEWFVVSIKGTLGVYAEKNSSSFPTFLADQNAPTNEEGNPDSVALTKENLSQQIKSGGAFPVGHHQGPIGVAGLEKSWWGYQHMRMRALEERNNADLQVSPQKGVSDQSHQNNLKCSYCIASVSESVELLYMPLATFQTIVYPSQDLSYSTERCRSLLQIPPGERKVADVNYLIHNLLKPHVFFQQLVPDVCALLARSLTLGFAPERSVLVDAGEHCPFCYILLTGNCSLYFPGDGSTANSPIISKTKLGSPKATNKGVSVNAIIGAGGDESEDDSVYLGDLVESLVPGDIFGAQTMMRNMVSPHVLFVKDDSEFIVLSGEFYRQTVGFGDLEATHPQLKMKLLEKELGPIKRRSVSKGPTSFKRADSETSMSDSNSESSSEENELPSSLNIHQLVYPPLAKFAESLKDTRRFGSAFKCLWNAPVNLLNKLQRNFHLTTFTPRSALGKTNECFTLIVTGSVSLHKLQKANAASDAFQDYHVMIDKSAGKRGTLLKNEAPYDVENRKVRNWWKGRRVQEASLVVEGGFVLGGYNHLHAGGGIGGWYAFTRCECLAVTFSLFEGRNPNAGDKTRTETSKEVKAALCTPPANKLGHYPTEEDKSRLKACDAMNAELRKLGGDVSQVSEEVVLRLFNTNPVLAKRSPNLICRIAKSCCSVRNFESGDEIPFWVTSERYLCIVLEGSVEIWVSNSVQPSAVSLPDDVQLVCLGPISPGDWFGDKALDDAFAQGRVPLAPADYGEAGVTDCPPHIAKAHGPRCRVLMIARSQVARAVTRSLSVASTPVASLARTKALSDDRAPLDVDARKREEDEARVRFDDEEDDEYVSTLFLTAGGVKAFPSQQSETKNNNTHEPYVYNDSVRRSFGGLGLAFSPIRKTDTEPRRQPGGTIGWGHVASDSDASAVLPATLEETGVKVEKPVKLISRTSLREPTGPSKLTEMQRKVNFFFPKEPQTGGGSSPRRGQNLSRNPSSVGGSESRSDETSVYDSLGGDWMRRNSGIGGYSSYGNSSVQNTPALSEHGGESEGAEIDVDGKRRASRKSVASNATSNDGSSLFRAVMRSSAGAGMISAAQAAWSNTGGESSSCAQSERNPQIFGSREPRLTGGEKRLSGRERAPSGRVRRESIPEASALERAKLQHFKPLIVKQTATKRIDYMSKRLSEIK